MANIRKMGNRGYHTLANTSFSPFSDMIDSFFNSSMPTMRAWESATFRVDICDEEDKFIVEAEMPGVKKDELSIEFNDGRLTIGVNREETTEEKDEGKRYIHKETRNTSMSRTMVFDHVDGDHISAKLDEGMLIVEVPKLQEEDKTKKIEIS